MIAMESSTILTADVLDIIFEGRNKDYGAYDLRRTYNRRLTVSITVMLSVICMLTIGYAFAGKKSKADRVLLAKDIQLAAVEPQQRPVEPLPPPVKQPPPTVQVQTVKLTPPVIAPDEQVPENEMPPVETIENAQIGKLNQDGQQDDGTVVAPPLEGSGNVVSLPTKEAAEEDNVFVKVEIESLFPGGPAAWQRFLYKNLRYPQDAQDQGIQGFVTVQFIVDKEGNVSDVQAVDGPRELQAEAIRVIRKSGKWTPAIQNGQPVKSYKKQPIGFRISEE
jgi:periplasmic protein TonB